MYASLRSYHLFYSPQKEPYEPPVVPIIELTPTTVSRIYKEPYLVMCFAPWCTHCTEFKPVYQELVRTFSRTGKTLAFATADCEAYPSMVQLFDLSGIPTFILIKNGKQLTYEGKRDIDALRSWLVKKL